MTDERSRYIEYSTIPAKIEDAGWMIIKDRATGEAFGIGHCSRETHIKVLRALNYYDEHMDK